MLVLIRTQSSVQGHTQGFKLNELVLKCNQDKILNVDKLPNACIDESRYFQAYPTIFILLTDT